MTKILRIGIDIDNVIADSYPQYIHEFNRTFSTDVKYEEIFDFYYLENNAGVEKAQVELFISKILQSAEFQLALPSVQEARRVIRKWSTLGYLMHYITARPKGTRDVTKKWLVKNGFWGKNATLDLVGGETHQRDPNFKKIISDNLKIDLMIEDSKEIAQVLDIPVFLIDRPWNQGKLPKNVKRVKSWEEIDKLAFKLLIH